jgi:hypothetical protein
MEQQIAAQAFAGYAFVSQVSAYLRPESRIASQLLSVREVESVYIHRTKDITQVWTIVDAPAEEVYDAIYERERAVIRELAPDRFDFHVVSRRGRPLRSILTLVSYPVWMRR